MASAPPPPIEENLETQEEKDIINKGRIFRKVFAFRKIFFPSVQSQIDRAVLYELHCIILLVVFRLQSRKTFFHKIFHIVLCLRTRTTFLINSFERYSTSSSASCLVRRSLSRSFSITGSFFTRSQYLLDVPLVRLTSSSKISVNSSASSRS